MSAVTPVVIQRRLFAPAVLGPAQRGALQQVVIAQLVLDRREGGVA